MQRKTVTISKQAEKLLKAYSWPGNVRQLENAVIYAINIVRGNELEAEDLPSYLLSKSIPPPSPSPSMDGGTANVYKLDLMEKIVIENALYKTRNNITKAAELLGLAKSTLYRKIRDYGIDVEA
jgi:DNA-binding NtrC family response regulator